MIGRRDFITLLAGAAAAWPLAARAQQAAMPVVALVGGAGGDISTRYSTAFRKGLNETGIIERQNVEVAAKRLGLLHELVPNAARIAVLVNPANASSAESTLRYIPEAARAIGLQSQVLNASSNDEIDAAFAVLVRERVDALFVAPDAFFSSRRVQRSEERRVGKECRCW